MISPATRLASDSAWIYGIVGSSVTLAPKVDGAESSRVHTLDGPAAGIVAHDGFAYVTLPAKGTIRRIDPRPAVATSIEVAAGQDEPTEIAADASSLYWVDAATHSLVALSFAPGAAPRAVAHIEGIVASIAVDATSVYVATGAKIIRITK